MNRRDLYSKENFTKDSLPHNRKEVFFDILKNHYFSFIKIGLVLFLFALPLLVTSFFLDYSFIIAHENETNNWNVILICSALEIVGLLILAIPISGLGKIYREYVWLEPVFFSDDFKKGFKDNYKVTAISFLIIGILNFIFNMVFYFLNNGWIIAIPFGFNVAVLYPILMHVIFLNFTYSNKYRDNFKVGCLLYFKHLPTTLLCTLLIIAIKVYDLFMLANIIAILTKYLVILFYFIFLLPLFLIGIQLNEMRIFDKHINSVRFPELLNKGIVPLEAIENEEESKLKEDNIESN